MRLGHGTLMVTQDSHHTVRVVIRVQLLLDRALFGRATIEQILERQRRVVCTEDLRGEPLHVRSQMTVQRASLQQPAPMSTPLYARETPAAHAR